MLPMPDMIMLIAAACIAGLVRGFSGFGTAMVYLPVAGQILGPFEAITTLLVMDLIGPIPAVPRAIRDGHPRDVLRMCLGMAVTLPLGIYGLTLVSPELFRYLVAGVSLGLLICLVGGIRYRGTLTKPMIYATGGASGISAGMAGLGGPPAILLYMASQHPPSVVRANTMLFLLLGDVMMLAMMLAVGRLVWEAGLIGALLIAPYMLANLVGTAIFDPNREALYRRVAFCIIAVSALSSLPLFD
jgi:uncharacterized membrane protein YfcA